MLYYIYCIHYNDIELYMLKYLSALMVKWGLRAEVNPPYTQVLCIEMMQLCGQMVREIGAK